MDHEIADFFFNNYFLLFYALAFIFSMVRYSKYFHTVLKYLPILIGYTLITEVLGFLIRDYDTIQIVYIEGYSYYNHLIFNIFDIIFFLYFFHVYRNTISSFKFKNWIKYGAILFIMCSIINPFFQDFLLYPQLMASTIGSIVLIFSILLYFLDKKAIANVPNRQNLLFWISWGLMFFYTFYPFILLLGYFDDELYKEFHVRKVQHILIVVMYSCFILGFILMRRIRSVEDI